MKEIRIRFKKTGRAKFISHLDLTRTMIRAVRRAGIPLWYTEGFNRHPYVTFAAPLSLGFEGLNECMDIRLVEDMSMEDMVARLNSVLPEGIEVIKAGEPVMKPGEIAFARYLMSFSTRQFKDIGENIYEFLSMDSIPVKKKTKKGDLRTIELKPLLENAVIETGDNAVTMEVTLPCSSQETVNPSLICTALNDFLNEKCGDSIMLFCDITRLNLLNAEGLMFE